VKTILRYAIIIALSLAVSAHAQPRVKPDIDDTSRFIFYSVVEGLYEDGVSNKDVDQILMKKEKQTYFHFIYACPVCGATIWALEAYRGRPERLYGLKREGSTFGNGLSLELHEQLYSGDPQKRLIAINTMVKTWMERRMKTMNLSAKDRAGLLEALEKKRKEGMDALESFRKLQHGPNFGVAEAAPAYVDLQECAVCNGAVGKPMKLPEPKPR
jgi:hypothetical protein